MKNIYNKKQKQTNLLPNCLQNTQNAFKFYKEYGDNGKNTIFT